MVFSTVNKPSPVAKQQQVQSAVKESRVPIIIVPPTTSPVITVYNAVDFLQDYKYNMFPINCSYDHLFISDTSVWRKRKTTVRKEKQR